MEPQVPKKTAVAIRTECMWGLICLPQVRKWSKGKWDAYVHVFLRCLSRWKTFWQFWTLQPLIMRFLSPILRVGSPPRCTLPLTVSWAVQCVLTLAHLHVSPMSNANHTGPQCCANPAISKLLSHSFISPHRLHCGTKQSTRMCCNCNCNSSVSHLRCQCSVLHNSEQFLYEHKHEAAIINQSPAITQAIY